MAITDKNLGTVTAYKYAKKAGYTGTEEEFEEGLKNSAEYAENAQASAAAAAGSASAAAGSAGSAASANTAAQGAKTDALAAQSAAEAARDRAETAAQTLVLDPTLSSPTQAAQAEAAGLVRDKLDAFMAGSAELPVNVGSIQEKYVNYLTGKITNTHSTYGHVGFIKLPEGAVKVRYPRIQSTGSTDTWGIAFYSAADTSDYISGVKALRNAASTEYVPHEIAVPSGAKFVAFSVFKDTETYGAPYLYAVFDNEVLKSLGRIADSIAPAENGETASQSYAQGAYFFRNGSFCKALTSIASGASFTLNTNYSVTTVAAELFAALNN